MGKGDKKSPKATKNRLFSDPWKEKGLVLFRKEGFYL